MVASSIPVRLRPTQWLSEPEANDRTISLDF